MTDRPDPTVGHPQSLPAPYARLQPVNHVAVRWTAGFWGERFALCDIVTLPSMYEALNNADNSAVFSNFYVAAGRQQGQHRGTFWSDGDCYKWLEAAVYVYAVTGNHTLAAQLDELIAFSDRSNPRPRPWLHIAGSVGGARHYRHDAYLKRPRGARLRHGQWRRKKRK